MSKSATFEVGVSPPGSTFRFGSPTGGAWSPEAIEILSWPAPRSEDHGGRVPFHIPRDSELLVSILERLRFSGNVPILDYWCKSNPSADALSSVPIFLAVIDKQVKGFDTRILFEDQASCDLPKPEYVLGSETGCGLYKTQQYKLWMREPRRLGTWDVFRPIVDPQVHEWQMLVVSSAFRELIVSSGMSGCEFLPVAGPSATLEDRRLANGPAKTDLPDWHQWVITGRSNPLPVDEVEIIRGPCSLCGVEIGRDEPYRLSQPFKRSAFSSADVQLCDELMVGATRRIRTRETHIFVSSRFVEMCVRAKVRGACSLANRNGAFAALYFGPAY